MVGKLELRQAAADGVVVFDHNLFSDDAHVEQIAVEHLFTVAEARVEAGVGVRVAHQRNIVTHLQHRVAVRVGQNTVATNAFNIAAGLAVNTQFAQIFAIRPGHQLRADAVGADHRQVDFTFGIGIEAALAGDLLGAGLQILMLQLGHIAGADDQAHQTNQIGQGIAEAQMVKRLRQLIAGQAEMAQGVARAHQHRGGGHGACQHTGGEPDIPAEHFTQHHGDQHRAADHHQRQHQVVFPVAEKNRKKVGPGFYANAKNKQHKAEIKGIGVNREMLLA